MKRLYVVIISLVLFFAPLGVAPHEIYDVRLIPDLSDEFKNYGYLPVEIATTTFEVIKKEPFNPISCSCILYLKSLGKKVSGNAWNLQSNTIIKEGTIALFHYPNHLGHAALVTKVENDGFFVSETNYKRCTYTERFIRFDYRALYGFYQ